MDLSPWGMPAVHKKRLSAVQRALSAKRLLSFDYQGAGAEQMRRTVEPGTLVFEGHSWYLYAFCRTREDFRLFRISRMREPVIEDERYHRRASTYDSEAVTGSAPTSASPRGVRDAQPKPTRFVLRFHRGMRSIVEDSFDADDLEVEDDGSVEVLSPPRVREIIAREARKIASIYEPDRAVSQG